MSQDYSTQERLRILRLNDHERRWYSVDDRRLCTVCQRIISGRVIRISGGPDDYTLACATEDCPGKASNWLIFEPTADHGPKAPEPDVKGEMDFLAGFAHPELEFLPDKERQGWERGIPRE